MGVGGKWDMQLAKATRTLKTTFKDDGQHTSSEMKELNTKASRLEREEETFKGGG